MWLVIASIFLTCMFGVMFVRWWEQKYGYLMNGKQIEKTLTRHMDKKE